MALETQTSNNICNELFKCKFQNNVKKKTISTESKIPIHRTVLDRFRDVLWSDFLLAAQIRDRPGYLQRPRVRPGAKPQTIDGHLQKPPPLILNRAELLDLSGPHLRVAVYLFP